MINLMNKSTLLTILCFAIFSTGAFAQQEEVSRTNNNVFRQLGTELPTPNAYRTASGAPGHDYWQQQVDYDMKLKLTMPTNASMVLKLLPTQTTALMSLDT